jgi:hypothetical protein
MAGEIGQSWLDQITAAHRPARWLAALDQHVAEVRGALSRSGDLASWLGSWPDVPGLMAYASGFVEAAVASGWQPPRDGEPDWESFRLAAVCHLVQQAQEKAGSLRGVS